MAGHRDLPFHSSCFGILRNYRIAESKDEVGLFLEKFFSPVGEHGTNAANSSGEILFNFSVKEAIFYAVEQGRLPIECDCDFVCGILLQPIDLPPVIVAEQA